MGARIDQSIRAIGVEEMTGFFPLLQGPAQTMPGTIYVSTARAAAMRLIPFIFNPTQQYVVEASAGKLRFYTNDVRIDLPSGDAYEIDAPWSAEQIAELNWSQVGDTLYLYHGDVQTRILRRLTATTFDLVAWEPVGGPFEARNRDQSLMVTASNVTGSVTLNATSALWAASDVGGLFRMEAIDLGSIPVHEPGVTVSAGDVRQWNGLVFLALTGGRTGSYSPSHVEGAEYDGMASGTYSNGDAAGGILWQYLHDRFGLLRITGYTSATEVTATVLRRLPFTMATGQSTDPGGNDYTGSPITVPWEPGISWGDYEPPPTQPALTPGCWRWQFGSYSDRLGWPTCGTIWQERHIVARDNRIDGSVIGGFDDFSPLNPLGDASRDMAFAVTLPDAAPVRWLFADTRLAIGTGNAEYIAGAASAAAGVGPGNVEVVRQSRVGSAQGMPVDTDGRLLFRQASCVKVQELAYQVERDRMETPDLTRFADHVGAAGVDYLVWQGEPARLLWVVLSDGRLAAALYEPKEQALGWATRSLGGGWSAVSICSIRDPDGKFDQLWIGASDGSDGHVLRMARPAIAGDEAARQVMSDACLIYEGSAVSAVIAPWLADQSVELLADGIPIRAVADGSGIVGLPAPASEVIYGLPFPSRLTLLSPEAGGDNGPAQGKLARVVGAGLRLLGSRGLSVTAQSATISIEPWPGLLDAEYAPFSGDLPINIIGDWRRDSRLRIERTLPYPSTVLAVMWDLSVQSFGGRA